MDDYGIYSALTRPHLSEPHLDAEAVVCGCTVLLFARDNSKDVAVFEVCH